MVRLYVFLIYVLPVLLCMSFPLGYFKVLGLGVDEELRHPRLPVVV